MSHFYGLTGGSCLSYWAERGVLCHPLSHKAIVWKIGNYVLIIILHYLLSRNHWYFCAVYTKVAILDFKHWKSSGIFFWFLIGWLLLDVLFQFFEWVLFWWSRYVKYVYYGDDEEERKANYTDIVRQHFFNHFSEKSDLFLVPDQCIFTQLRVMLNLKFSQHVKLFSQFIR